MMKGMWSHKVILYVPSINNDNDVFCVSEGVKSRHLLSIWVWF